MQTKRYKQISVFDTERYNKFLLFSERLFMNKLNEQQKINYMKYKESGLRISLVDRLIATRDIIKIQLAINLLNGYNFI